MAAILRKYNGDAKHPSFQAQTSGGLGRLSRIFHLSSRKKKDILDIPSGSPTCEESIHYPVFNPQDPRHNPLGASKSRSRTQSYPSRISNHGRRAQWGQVLPKTPLRKAKSGLMSVTAGIRGSTVHLRRYSIGAGLSESHVQRKEDTVSVSVSETTTADDPDFGVDIHRTRCNLSRISYPPCRNSSNSHANPPAILYRPHIVSRNNISGSGSASLRYPKPRRNQNSIASIEPQASDISQDAKWVDNDLEVSSPEVKIGLTARDISPTRIVRGSSESSIEAYPWGFNAHKLLTLPEESSTSLLGEPLRESSMDEERVCDTQPDLHYDAARRVKYSSNGRRPPLPTTILSDLPSGLLYLPSYETVPALSIAAPKTFY